MIKTKTYSINNLPLTNELLVIFISKFWDEIFSSIKNTKHLLILCKVQFSDTDMGYRTLGSLRKVNYEDRDLFIDFLTQNLSILNESYMVHPILNITFSYIIKDGLCTDQNRALLTELNEKESRFHSFNNMNLPVSMEPGDYGEIISSSYIDIDEVSYHRFIVKYSNKVYQIDRNLDKSHNKVTILGNINLSWIDTKLLDVGEDIFKREIKKSTFYFMGGEVVLRKQVLPAKPFKKLVPDNKLVNNFLTMDIETINKDNKQVPYLICAYNGTDYITSYGSDQNALFKVFFDQLLHMVKSSATIYAHNLSGFDGIFLMKHLLSYGKIDPLLFNGKLISIKVKILGPSSKMGNGVKTIIFKDSMLLLPLSLRKLCKAFNIEVPKGHFPFKLTNIFYTGIIPRFESWTGISLSEYGIIKAAYKGKLWNFQQEAIKYCKLDCKVLHEIIIKFNELIFKEFNINVHIPLTLPALAMRIYKTHYMPEDTIYQLLGNVENNIRQSYTGGAVDVYIPHNRIGDFFKQIKGFFIKLYYYDVNSLYPYVMAYFKMPIGKPIAFDGDIRKIDSNAYGFFYCNISSPKELEHPILQRRIKTSEGMRTIAGLGNWTGWICSLEMDNAMKYGYTFEILKGYQFETGDIFSGYINKLYNLRKEYDKTHPMNLIAKLLMNSLYGKFGMRLVSTEILMYDYSTEEGQKSLHEDIDCWGLSIQDFVKIDDYFLIIRNTRLSYKYNEELDMFHGQDINIAIASAITAGARVHMSYFKNNPDFRLYYSDTDSAIIDRPLPSFMVGSKLGQLKLEHTIDKAVFLAPKVYGLVDVDGNETIKIKGVTGEVASKLTINDLEELLIKDSQKEFTQEKWFKKVLEGEITTSDIVYTLKVTSNKRAPQYIIQGELEIYDSTRPYNYDEITSN